jgi:hypothetical protein
VRVCVCACLTVSCVFVRTYLHACTCACVLLLTRSSTSSTYIVFLRAGTTSSRTRTVCESRRVRCPRCESECSNTSNSNTRNDTKMCQPQRAAGSYRLHMHSSTARHALLHVHFWIRGASEYVRRLDAPNCQLLGGKSRRPDAHDQLSSALHLCERRVDRAPPSARIVVTFFSALIRHTQVRRVNSMRLPCCCFLCFVRCSLWRWSGTAPLIARVCSAQNNTMGLLDSIRDEHGCARRAASTYCHRHPRARLAALL